MSLISAVSTTFADFYFNLKILLTKNKYLHEEIAYFLGTTVLYRLARVNFNW